MTKTLCEQKKLLKTDIKAWLQLVSNPTHICRRCGRLANKKKLLCKSIKLSNVSDK